MSVRSAERRGLSAFCDGNVPWRLISELADGEDVIACYIVQETRRLETKSSKPYIRLRLADRSGAIDGMIWEDADHWEPSCEISAVVGVRGRVGLYNEQPQLKINSIEILEPAPTDWGYLLPTSRRSLPEMERELDSLISTVRDPGLRALLRRCLGKGTASGAAYRSHPAATRNHHAYIGGLLEHSLSVAGTCEKLVAHYSAQGLELDRDLLVAGALLHDLGKVRELEALPKAGYTTEGRLLGHIVIGMQLVEREARSVRDLPEDRLVLLQHLIASHQGKPEWDSPRVPQMREALVLHYADDLDAKLNQVAAVLDGVSPGEWSAFDRSLGRSFLASSAPAGGGSAQHPAARDQAVIDLFRS